MTTYVTRQTRIVVSEDRGGTKLVFRRGDTETKFTELSELNEASFSKLVLPDTTTDKDLMEGQEISAARILYLETDKELLVKLADVGDTGITVKPVSTTLATENPGVLYLEGDFTHVYVTVVGATESANVKFGIVGA